MPSLGSGLNTVRFSEKPIRAELVEAVSQREQTDRLAQGEWLNDQYCD